MSDRSPSIPEKSGVPRALAAEAVGSFLLLATIVGSGIMGERLSGGIPGVALLANSIATGAMLVTLIFTFRGTSGAHFNPAVTAMAVIERDLTGGLFLPYAAAQLIGAAAGVVCAHAMFGDPLIQQSANLRPGGGQLLSEALATFGLLLILYGNRTNKRAVPLLAGAYITSAYWFTASTSFANPAVTAARSLTSTFAGISASRVIPFIAAQAAGTLAAIMLGRVLFQHSRPGEFE